MLEGEEEENELTDYFIEIRKIKEQRIKELEEYNNNLLLELGSLKEEMLCERQAFRDQIREARSE